MDLFIVNVNAAVARLAAEPYTFGAYELDCECEKPPEELAALERQGRVHRLGHAADRRLDCCPSPECLRALLDSKFEYIDRRAYSVQDKPRVWPCQFCHIRLGQPALVHWRYMSYTSWHVPAGGAVLGGGCEWYCCPSLGIDCCMECWNGLTAAQLCPPVAIDPEAPYFTNYDGTIMFRGPSPVAAVADPRPLLPLDSELHFNCDTVKLAPHHGIFELNGVDTATGNIFSWLPICDETPAPGDAVTGLLVDVADARLPVASIAYDDHGRVSIVRVFSALSECLDLYNEWKSAGGGVAGDDGDSSDSGGDDGNDGAASDSESGSESDSDSDSDAECDKLAARAKHFSAYVRFHKKLGVYFG